MLAQEVYREGFAFFGALDALIWHVLDEAERCEPLQHRSGGGGCYAHVLRDFASADGLDLALQPPDSFHVLLDRFRDFALIALAPAARAAGGGYAKVNFFDRHKRIQAETTRE